MSEQPSVFGSNTHSQVLLPTCTNTHTYTHLTRKTTWQHVQLQNSPVSNYSILAFKEKHKQMLSSLIQTRQIFLHLNHQRPDLCPSSSLWQDDEDGPHLHLPTRPTWRTHTYPSGIKTGSTHVDSIEPWYKLRSGCHPRHCAPAHCSIQIKFYQITKEE